MQAFQSQGDGEWISQVDSHEALVLAAVFEDLAEALEKEATRDVLDMMGVKLDGDSPGESSLMFESSLAADNLDFRPTSHSTRNSAVGKRFSNAPGSKPEGGSEAEISFSAKNSLSPKNYHKQRGESAVEPNADSGLTDDQRLEKLDFDPLSLRPVPSNPYVAAILRPMSSDPDTAAELRALTTPDLASRKSGAMRAVAAGLRWSADQHLPVVVKAQTLKNWVSAVNDARLALGWSLGIEDEARSEEIEIIAGADPELGVYTVYEITLASIYSALTWWLDSLMIVVDTPE